MCPSSVAFQVTWHSSTYNPLHVPQVVQGMVFALHPGRVHAQPVLPARPASRARPVSLGLVARRALVGVRIVMMG